MFFPSFYLDIDRFQGQSGAAAGAFVTVEPQHRLLRGNRPHVEAAFDFFAEVQQHIAPAAIDFFRHSYLAFFFIRLVNPSLTLPLPKGEDVPANHISIFQSNLSLLHKEGLRENYTTAG
jgi:hypothetical protein